MKKPLFIILGLIFLSSCGEKYFYSEEKEIPDGIWTYNNKLEYQFEIQDTTNLYELSLDIRHDKEYPSQNMYYQVHTTFPSGKKLSQVLSAEFYDKSGKCYGKCSGSSCLVPLVLRDGLYFNETGKFNIELEQYSRTDSLKGILSLTLNLKEKGKRK